MWRFPGDTAREGLPSTRWKRHYYLLSGKVLDTQGGGAGG